MMLTLQLPTYFGGRRPVVTVEKYIDAPMFGHMWHVTLADGTSTFAFGDEPSASSPDSSSSSTTRIFNE